MSQLDIIILTTVFILTRQASFLCFQSKFEFYCRRLQMTGGIWNSESWTILKWRNNRHYFTWFLNRSKNLNTVRGCGGGGCPGLLLLSWAWGARWRNNIDKCYWPGRCHAGCHAARYTDSRRCHESSFTPLGPVTAIDVFSCDLKRILKPRLYDKLDTL